MPDITRVPVRVDADNLLILAMILTSPERITRLRYLAGASRKLRAELAIVGADLVKTPAGPDRERVKALSRDMTSRLVALDDWTEALKSAQESNYLDN